MEDWVERIWEAEGWKERNEVESPGLGWVSMRWCQGDLEDSCLAPCFDRLHSDERPVP